MSLDWKKCFLNVPLNSAGLIEHDSDDPEWKNVFTVEITNVEYNLLSDVFYDWNCKFHVLYFYPEEEYIRADIILPEVNDGEETLDPENAQEAMEILKRHIEKKSDNQDFLSAAEKLKSALEKAIEVKMPLFLDF